MKYPSIQATIRIVWTFASGVAHFLYLLLQLVTVKRTTFFVNSHARKHIVSELLLEWFIIRPWNALGAILEIADGSNICDEGEKHEVKETQSALHHTEKTVTHPTCQAQTSPRQKKVLQSHKTASKFSTRQEAKLDGSSGLDMELASKPEQMGKASMPFKQPSSLVHHVRNAQTQSPSFPATASASQCTTKSEEQKPAETPMSFSIGQSPEHKFRKSVHLPSPTPLKLNKLTTRAKPHHTNTNSAHLGFRAQSPKTSPQLAQKGRPASYPHFIGERQAKCIHAPQTFEKLPRKTFSAADTSGLVGSSRRAFVPTHSQHWSSRIYNASCSEQKLQTNGTDCAEDNRRFVVGAGQYSRTSIAHGVGFEQVANDASFSSSHRGPSERQVPVSVRTGVLFDTTRFSVDPVDQNNYIVFPSNRKVLGGSMESRGRRVRFDI